MINLRNRPKEGRVPTVTECRTLVITFLQYLISDIWIFKSPPVSDIRHLNLWTSLSLFLSRTRRTELQRVPVPAHPYLKSDDYLGHAWAGKKGARANPMREAPWHAPNPTGLRHVQIYCPADKTDKSITNLELKTTSQMLFGLRAYSFWHTVYVVCKGCYNLHRGRKDMHKGLILKSKREWTYWESAQFVHSRSTSCLDLEYCPKWRKNLPSPQEGGAADFIL